MATTEERRERIARVAALPTALDALVSELTDAALDARSPDDPWSVRQVVHHVADSHANAFIRTKLVLTEEHPTFKPYDQDAWANLPDTTLPLAVSLGMLRGIHTRWVALFEAMGEEVWAQGGLHPEYGEQTLDRMLASYAQHGEDHLDQIRRILAGVRS
jgi:hypothetical protein